MFRASASSGIWSLFSFHHLHAWLRKRLLQSVREGETSLSLNKWGTFLKYLLCAWKHFNTCAQAYAGYFVLFSFDPHKSHLKYRLSFPFYRGGNWMTDYAIFCIQTNTPGSEYFCLFPDPGRRTLLWISTGPGIDPNFFTYQLSLLKY